MDEFKMCCGTTCDKRKVQEQIDALKAERDGSAKLLSARIARSADVEQILFDMANGKLAPFNAQDCRVLALRLGTPKKDWSEKVAEHKFAVARVEGFSLNTDGTVDATGELDLVQQGGAE